MDLMRLASEGKVKELTDHLASKRLDIDARLLEHEEWNALQLACCEGDDTAVTTLLSAGASVDFQVDSHVMPRHSPLMLACRFGYIKVVQVLLDGGASANLGDNYGYTALHYACAGGHIKVVELLLKAGAHASTLSEDGSSPRDFALGQGHSRLSEILKAWEGKYSDDGLRKFKAWLDAIDCGSFFDQFVRAGYDLPFTSKHGLDDADLDCVGVPMSMLGLRKKLKALHRLEEFVPTSEDEDDESEEDEEGEEEEDEEEEEEG